VGIHSLHHRREHREDSKCSHSPERSKKSGKSKKSLTRTLTRGTVRRTNSLCGACNCVHLMQLTLTSKSLVYKLALRETAARQPQGKRRHSCASAPPRGRRSTMNAPRHSHRCQSCTRCTPRVFLEFTRQRQSGSGGALSAAQKRGFKSSVWMLSPCPEQDSALQGITVRRSRWTELNT